eukprot:Pgem_evm2s19529
MIYQAVMIQKGFFYLSCQNFIVPSIIRKYQIKSSCISQMHFVDNKKIEANKCSKQQLRYMNRFVVYRTRAGFAISSRSEGIISLGTLLGKQGTYTGFYSVWLVIKGRVGADTYGIDFSSIHCASGLIGDLECFIKQIMGRMMRLDEFSFLFYGLFVNCLDINDDDDDDSRSSINNDSDEDRKKISVFKKLGNTNKWLNRISKLMFSFEKKSEET